MVTPAFRPKCPWSRSLGRALSRGAMFGPYLGPYLMVWVVLTRQGPHSHPHGAMFGPYLIAQVVPTIAFPQRAALTITVTHCHSPSHPLPPAPCVRTGLYSHSFFRHSFFVAYFTVTCPPELSLFSIGLSLFLSVVPLTAFDCHSSSPPCHGPESMAPSPWPRLYF